MENNQKRKFKKAAFNCYNQRREMTKKIINYL